jgi:Uma2 family endonuclease
MASTTLVPLEEFIANINTKYERTEYVDGVLIEKPVPNLPHGTLQVWVGYLLLTRYRHQYSAASEVHSRVSPRQVRIPDIAVQRRGVGVDEIYPETPYILTIEILSPEDKLGAALAKCEVYHEWGVPYCWVLDPEKRHAWIYNKDDEPKRVEDALDAGDIRFELAEVWQGLDETLA